MLLLKADELPVKLRGLLLGDLIQRMLVDVPAP